MVKLWSRLCFLVLVISSVSRGQDVTVPTADTVADVPLNTSQTSLPPAEPPAEAAQATPSTHTSPPPTTQNTTDTHSGNVTTQGEKTSTEVKTTQEVNGTKAEQTTARVNPSEVDVDATTTVSTATASTSAAAGTPKVTESSSWGYVLLVLIILVIIALCAILYRLRRVSRTYSFDLNRQVPANHHNEPIGTFEPVYLDDLERPAPKDLVITDDLSPPVSNGTALQSEERGSNGETDTSTPAPAPAEQPDANGLETSPTSDTSPSLGDDPADDAPSPLSSNLFFDAIGEEQQNENNNNPSVCSSDPFVEINLDGPAWCDQLLTSPEAPSSVLPFTSFSFSSSSSSSSS